MKANILKMPDLKANTVETVSRCPHLAGREHTMTAAITLQPVATSPLAPIATLLCARCAHAVSSALFDAMKKAGC